MIAFGLLLLAVTTLAHDGSCGSSRYGLPAGAAQAVAFGRRNLANRAPLMYTSPLSSSGPLSSSSDSFGMGNEEAPILDNSDIGSFPEQPAELSSGLPAGLSSSLPSSLPASLSASLPAAFPAAPVAIRDTPVQQEIQAPVQEIQEPEPVQVQEPIQVQEPVQVQEPIPIQEPIQIQEPIPEPQQQEEIPPPIEVPVQEQIRETPGIKGETKGQRLLVSASETHLTFPTPTRSFGAAHLNLPSAADEISDSSINIQFSCEGRPYGYYADIYNNCQLYHICREVPLNGVTTMQRFSFFCPIGTLFDQVKHVCVSRTAEDLTPCHLAQQYFPLTAARFAAPPPAMYMTRMTPAATWQRATYATKGGPIVQQEQQPLRETPAQLPLVPLHPVKGQRREITKTTMFRAETPVVPVAPLAPVKGYKAEIKGQRVEAVKTFRAITPVKAVKGFRATPVLTAPKGYRAVPTAPKGYRLPAVLSPISQARKQLL